MGHWVLPSSLPAPVIEASAYNRVAVLAIAQKRLPFCQEQGSSSPSRPKTDRGTVNLGELAACSPHMEEPDLLQDSCVQREPPPSPPSSLSSQFFRAEQTAPILLSLKQSHFFCGSHRRLSLPAVICLQHATRIMLKRGGQGKRIINYILRVCVNRSCKRCQMEKKIELP